MSEMTPMMLQYLEIKKEYPDTILFFRLGDFYEMFFDDAKTASSVLELTLTSRACGHGEKAPMCGVPFHSADNYIAKLVQNGYKVAICEQVEDPATAKGIVKRDVIRIVTKGSAIESNMLDEDKNNYLTVIFLDEKGCGICFTDVSTGTVNLTFIENSKTIDNDIVDELGVFSPSEIVLNSVCAKRERIVSFISKKIQASCELPDDIYFDYNDCLRVCNSHFGQDKIESYGLISTPGAVIAVGATLKYLRNAQKNDLSNITDINFYSENQYMKIDYSTKRNLEVTQNMRDGKKQGTLLWVLDKTKTSMGKRLLRSWLEKPLVNITQINKRHMAVNELYNDSIRLGDISDAISGIFDIERLITRIAYQSANGKDLNALRQSLEKIPAVKELLKNSASSLLKQQYSSLDTLEDICELITCSIKEDAPFTVREGDMIKDGFNTELDTLRDIQNNSKQYIAEIEQREKEKTGIPKLKS